MPKKAKSARTPARIMADLIECALIVSGQTKTKLAKMANVSLNTVCNDLKDPERIPQGRLWLYFAALGAPMDDALKAVAETFAISAVKRRKE